MIDLIGYRRFGHNETDEPAYTQPEMAALIKKKEPVREVFAAQLVEQGVMTQGRDRRARPGDLGHALAPPPASSRRTCRGRDEEQPTGGYELDRSPSPEVKTAVDADALQAPQRRAARHAGRASPSTRS